MYLPPQFQLFEAVEEIVDGARRERWLSSFFGSATEPAESVSLGLRGEKEAVLVSTALAGTYSEPGGLYAWAVHLATQAAKLDSETSLAAMRDVPETPLLEGSSWSFTYEWGGVQVWRLADGRAVSMASRSGRLHGLASVREVQDWQEYEIDGSVAHPLREMSAYRQGHGPSWALIRELDGSVVSHDSASALVPRGDDGGRRGREDLKQTPSP